MRGGEVEGEVGVALEVGVGGGHRVVGDVLSKFCILQLGGIWTSDCINAFLPS